MIGSKSTIALILVSVLALSGCRTAQLKNINDAPYGLSAVSSPAQLSMEDYEKAIIRAGSKRNWVFQRVDTGHLVATNTVRGKHTAVVDVTFDNTAFSITFKSSSNLNHDASSNQIHPNYNHWVTNLEKDIRAEVQLARAS